jgi:hypothetical protein
LLIYSFGISIFGDIEEFDQLYYELTDLPLFAFGIVGFIWSALNSIGSYYAYKFKQKYWSFYVLPLISAALLFLVGFIPSIPTIALLLLSYFMVAPLGVLIDSRIQHNIKSISRATTTSISALLIYFFGVFLTLIFGIISKIWNLEMIYISTSLFLALLSIWIFFNRKVFSG